MPEPQRPYFRGGPTINGAQTGDLLVCVGDQDFDRLTVPSDFDSVPYVLGINPFTGIPAWRVVDAAVFAAGFGSAFGGGFGES